MIEFELTYLAKFLPDLSNCKSKEIIDIYYPLSSRHPTLRLRKNGDKYEMTKKQPINNNDSSIQEENTIPLTKEEWENLSKAQGKKTHKIRYYYPYQSKIAEIDVFQGDLKGLVLVDIEFNDEKEKNQFKTPDFCLVEITQEEFIAGGMVCGKRYEDLEPKLKEFGYQRL
jgi:CYTH domain-containing protein